MAASYTRVPTSSAHPVGGRSSARISCAEHVMTVGSRIYFSSFYRVIYFIMVLSSLLCIVWVSSAAAGLVTKRLVLMLVSTDAHNPCRRA